MGSYDGAETSELIGIFLLNMLKDTINTNDMGLYRDDGLIVLRNKSSQQTDNIRKVITQKFKNAGFGIEITTNLPTVNYLDLTLDLNKGTYKPYRKSNEPPIYIHTSSNHPQSIIKQIPKGISRRITDNSTNENIFNKEKNTLRKCLKNKRI